MKFPKLTRRLFMTVAFSLLAAVAAPICASAPLRADEPEYQEIRDIVYKKVGDREIKLNLFLPVEDGQIVKGRPLLIYISSGCWNCLGAGDGGVWTSLGARKRGFAIASVAHRPISEAIFPAPIEDVRAAVRFLRKHAQEYGYDPDRFAATGTSSGGHLSLCLGVSDAASIYDVGENLDVSGQVQRVIDFFGPADFVDACTRRQEQPGCIFDALGVARDAADPESPEYDALMERGRKFSPIVYVDADYAPTFLLHGAEDPVVSLSQSVLMYEQLVMNGVRTRIHVGDGGVHDPRTLGSVNFLAREIFEFLQW